MDDDAIPTADAAPQASPLREALRRARIEAAEHSDVVIDLRHAELARLEILKEALAPIFADVPDEIDLFDVGLVPGDRPRLFIDMVSFVEMGRDRRLYRFIRDGRHGRVVAVENEQVQLIVDAVTDYVARRLVERERLLSDDDILAHPPVAQPLAETGSSPLTDPAPATAPATNPVHAQRLEMTAAAAPKKRRWLRALVIVLAFGLGGGLGAAVVVGFMVAAAKGLLPGIG